MKRAIVILLLVSLAFVKVALAAGTNNDWNAVLTWGTQTVNDAGVGYRTWYVPQATGNSGTLHVTMCVTNGFIIEPNSSLATFDVWKCSQQFDRGDALEDNCGKYTASAWDSDGGVFEHIGDYIMIDVIIADAAAEIVHMCGD